MIEQGEDGSKIDKFKSKSPAILKTSWISAVWSIVFMITKMYRRSLRFTQKCICPHLSGKVPYPSVHIVKLALAPEERINSTQAAEFADASQPVDYPCPN